MHEAGLVHRDLKPGNVLLSDTGPRLIDFGIARDVDTLAAHTQAGQVMGSPGWVAPERLVGGPALPASDVFAWGCLIAYAATGHHPFGSGEADVLTRRILVEPPRVSGVPEMLRPAVEAALAKEPERRPRAADLLGALLAAGGIGDPWDPREAVAEVLAEIWTPVPYPAGGGRVRLASGGPLSAPSASAASWSSGFPVPASAFGPFSSAGPGPGGGGRRSGTTLDPGRSGQAAAAVPPGQAAQERASSPGELRGAGHRLAGDDHGGRHRERRRRSRRRASRARADGDPGRRADHGLDLPRHPAAGKPGAAHGPAHPSTIMVTTTRTVPAPSVAGDRERPSRKGRRERRTTPASPVTRASRRSRRPARTPRTRGTATAGERQEQGGGLPVVLRQPEALFHPDPADRRRREPDADAERVRDPDRHGLPLAQPRRPDRRLTAAGDRAPGRSAAVTVSGASLEPAGSGDADPLG
nr:hypothetical protein GCM10020093_006180 [Planobispora longispora]